MPLTIDAMKAAYNHVFGCDFELDRGQFLECLYTTCIELPKPATVLEIGTYQGKSAFAMACALHGTGSRIICVDPIFIDDRIVCTDGHQPWSSYGTSLRDVLCRFARYDLAHMVSIVPGFSSWVYDHWDGLPLDMLFVDGAHTEFDVAMDCRWSTHVKVGGFALFDDWILPVEKAVEAYYKDRPEWELLHKSTAPVTPRWAISAYRRNA